jgi:nitroreductase
MTEPWRFRRVGPYTRDQLLDVYLDIKTAKAGSLTEEQTERLRAKFTTAAELLVIIRVRNDDHVIAREDYAAVACAIQNLTLSLHSEGVSSKWTTGAVTRDPRTYDLAEVDFDVERIEGFLWAGIAVAGEKPVRRLGPAEILRELP